MPDTHQTYGEKLNAVEIIEVLEHIFKANDRLMAEEKKRGTPVCIWGCHGIGKTEVVLGFAKKHGWAYAYCAPAQFEEMGDLHGLPETYDPTPESPNSGDEVTVFRPPQWLESVLEHTNTNKPGILILDDFNRADIRILRGCMQLLQMFGLFSWSLPNRWQIVCTANPEGGGYAVTPMDDAMLTRMIHMTMEFDAKSWAKWALDEGIDPRGIDFVLTYPEEITGQQTTARSITQFLRQIVHLGDLSQEKNMRILSIIGKGTIEDHTVGKFVHFIRFVQKTLIQPHEILDCQDFHVEVAPRLRSIIRGDGEGKRTDRLKTICTRLQLALTQESYHLEEKHRENVVSFLLWEEMDAALRFGIHRVLSNAENHRELRPLLMDPRLAMAIVQVM